MMQVGTLYLVATPIGSLQDMTLRAIDILKHVDLIASEDTRHSQLLLNHYQIHTKQLSLHEYNETTRSKLLCEKLSKGLNIALITDAGTPLISDPGYPLVKLAKQLGINVKPIPGPCALIAALIASGLPTHQFIFEGFLSKQTSEKKKQLYKLKEETRTIILYESTHRITQLIDLMINVFGPDREACIAKELTKTFETIQTGSLLKLQSWLSENQKHKLGEFVVILHGENKHISSIMNPHDQHTLSILLSELSVKQSVALAAKITGKSRGQLYQLALTLEHHR